MASPSGTLDQTDEKSDQGATEEVSSIEAPIEDIDEILSKASQVPQDERQSIRIKQAPEGKGEPSVPSQERSSGSMPENVTPQQQAGIRQQMNERRNRAQREQVSNSGGLSQNEKELEGGGNRSINPDNISSEYREQEQGKQEFNEEKLTSQDSESDISSEDGDRSTIAEEADRREAEKLTRQKKIGDEEKNLMDNNIQSDGSIKNIQSGSGGFHEVLSDPFRGALPEDLVPQQESSAKQQMDNSRNRMRGNSLSMRGNRISGGDQGEGSDQPLNVGEEDEEDTKQALDEQRNEERQQQQQNLNRSQMSTLQNMQGKVSSQQKKIDKIKKQIGSIKKKLPLLIYVLSIALLKDVIDIVAEVYSIGIWSWLDWMIDIPLLIWAFILQIEKDGKDKLIGWGIGGLEIIPYIDLLPAWTGRVLIAIFNRIKELGELTKKEKKEKKQLVKLQKDLNNYMQTLNKSG